MTTLKETNFSYYHEQAIQEMLEEHNVSEFIEIESNGYYGGYSDSEPLRLFVNSVCEILVEAFNGLHLGGAHDSNWFILPLTDKTQELYDEVFQGNCFFGGLYEDDKSTLYKSINSLLADYLNGDDYEANKLTEEIDSYYEFQHNMMLEYLTESEGLTVAQAEHCMYSDDFHDAMDDEIVPAMEQKYTKIDGE